MGLEHISMAMIMAQVQGLQKALDDVKPGGDCENCHCSTCETLRGMVMALDAAGADDN